jgi:hypothetical protein
LQNLPAHIRKSSIILLALSKKTARKPSESEIRLTEEGGEMCIDLVGELAGLLSLGTNKNARSTSAAGVLLFWLRE